MTDMRPPPPGAPGKMDRWLGDGGMALLGQLGCAFERYGAEGSGVIGAVEPGWCEGSWVVGDLACNPHGVVQAGVHSVVLDAAMNFAINSGLEGRDRTRATLVMKVECLTAARRGQALRFRGTVTRAASTVAFAEARVEALNGVPVSRATGTFLLVRET